VANIKHALLEKEKTKELRRDHNNEDEKNINFPGIRKRHGNYKRRRFIAKYMHNK
jgi:hypothetical protein